MARCENCIHSGMCKMEIAPNWNRENCSWCKPTADVVPKSEVEGIIATRLQMQQKKNEKHDYALGVLYDLLNEKDEEIKQLRDDNQFLQDRRFKEWSEVRQEVAREIFEEIDGCYMQMLEEVDSTIEEAILEENHSLARTAKYGKEVMLLTLDTLRKRLKKKYTESEGTE